MDEMKGSISPERESLLCQLLSAHCVLVEELGSIFFSIGLISSLPLLEEDMRKLRAPQVAFDNFISAIEGVLGSLASIINDLWRVDELGVGASSVPSTSTTV